MADQTPPSSSEKKPDKKPAQAPLFDIHSFMWVVSVFIIYSLMMATLQGGTSKISYTQFKQAVTENAVSAISFSGNEILGAYR